MIRKQSSAFFVLVVMVLPWPTLPLAVTAQDGTAEAPSAAVVLTDDQGQYPLSLHLEILEDPDGQLTIEQVASPEYNEHFGPNQEKAPNFGYTEAIYWVRFRARNETALTGDLRRVFGFANIQHVAVYTPLAQLGSSEPGFATKQTGTFYPLYGPDRTELPDCRAKHSGSWVALAQTAQGPVPNCTRMLCYKPTGVPVGLWMPSGY